MVSELQVVSDVCADKTPPTKLSYTTLRKFRPHHSEED